MTGTTLGRGGYKTVMDRSQQHIDRSFEHMQRTEEQLERIASALERIDQRKTL